MVAASVAPGCSLCSLRLQTGAGKSYSFVGYGVNKGILPIVSTEIFQKVCLLPPNL